MGRNDIKAGISFFSLSKEFHSKKYSFEQCLAKAAELGFEGVEVVAAQMVRGYPWPDDIWVEKFKELMLEYKLEPVCYSAYIDMGMRADRDLNEEEIIQFTVNDMKYAKRLGFPYVRTQHAISPAILEKMIPYAKEYGIWLGVELHRPHRMSTPVWQEYMELFERRGSEYIGVVPDMGVFQARPHILYLQMMVKSGVRQEIADLSNKYFCRGIEVEETINKIGNLTEQEKTMVRDMYKTFEPAPIEDLKLMIPHSKYMHGKFYYIGEDLKDNCVPYDKILPYIQKNGYKGYIATEYEGHLLDDEDIVDATEQIMRHVRMERKILGYD